MLTEIGNQGKERVWGEDGEGTTEGLCASTWRGRRCTGSTRVWK